LEFVEGAAPQLSEGPRALIHGNALVEGSEVALYINASQAIDQSCEAMVLGMKFL